MTSDRFNEIVEEFTEERIKNLLIKKGNEYSLDTDRLSNFKNGASISSWSNEQVLFGYQLKHITSYIDMINSGKKFPRELWLEKIGDLCNYGIILLAMLEDDNMFIDEKKSKKQDKPDKEAITSIEVVEVEKLNKLAKLFNLTDDQAENFYIAGIRALMNKEDK